MSNRKDQSADDTGKVKESISNLTQEMHDAGYEYLGDYFILSIIKERRFAIIILHEMNIIWQSLRLFVKSRS